MGTWAGTGEALAWVIASDVLFTSPSHGSNSGAAVHIGEGLRECRRWVSVMPSTGIVNAVNGLLMLLADIVNAVNSITNNAVDRYL